MSKPQVACTSKNGVLPLEIFSLSDEKDRILTVFQGDTRAIQLSVELHNGGWFAFVNRTSTGNSFSQIEGPVGPSDMVRFLEGFVQGVSWAGSVYLREVSRG